MPEPAGRRTPEDAFFKQSIRTNETDKANTSKKEVRKSQKHARYAASTCCKPIQREIAGRTSEERKNSDKEMR